MEWAPGFHTLRVEIAGIDAGGRALPVAIDKAGALARAPEYSETTRNEYVSKFIDMESGELSIGLARAYARLYVAFVLSFPVPASKCSCLLKPSVENH